MGILKCAFLLATCGLFVWDTWYKPAQVTEYSNPDLDFYATFDTANVQMALLHPVAKRQYYNHTLGIGLNRISNPKPKIRTFSSEKQFPDRFRVEWQELGRLEVALSKHKGDGVSCYNVAWSSLSEYFKPTDCFSLGHAHWYGGAEVLEQHWPIDVQKSKMQPYLTGDYLSPRWRLRPDYGRYGSMLEPYWISSSGLGIHVHENVTLHTSFNADGDGQLCLKSDRKGYVGADLEGFREWLNYTVCQGENILQVHKYMSTKFFQKPRALPDKRMIRSPIWSTWARYKVHVNQSSVLEYAKEIKKYGFSNSQIEIDDMYTTRYGDLDFNLVKFPNATKMTSQLHDLGFRVTSWVTPFANIDSRAFLEGAEKSYWLKTSQPHSVPSLTRWWQGTGAVLDPANKDAVHWYVKRLTEFQRLYGIDSFKFDAGEVDFLPRDMDVPPSIVNTNHLTDLYVRLTESFGGMVEVRSGYRSQDVPVFFRMLDKDSTWTYENGLRSMIPTALFMSTIGYPFILPDMIGGNGYVGSEPLSTTSLPDRELFVRWLELSAFLPSMQFSIAPWQYDEEVVIIAKKFVQLHESLVTPEILRAAENALKTGEPIIRPLWWMDQSEDSLAIDTQFLIGDSILVAPVVDLGVRSRDVYLPGRSERWKNYVTKEAFQGGQWLKSVSAPLDQVPVFLKIHEN